MLIRKDVLLQHGGWVAGGTISPLGTVTLSGKVCRGKFYKKLFRKIWANMFNKVVPTPLLNRQVCRQESAFD